MRDIGIGILCLIGMAWAGAGFNCPPTTRPTFDTEADLLTYLGVDIVCNSYDVEIYMDACALLSLGYDPLTDVGAANASAPVIYSYDIQDPTCMGVDTGLGEVLFAYNLSVCDPQVVATSSQLVYTLTIRSIYAQQTAGISRAAPFSVSFTCTYILTMQKSLAHAVFPVFYASPVKMTTQKGELNVMMALFANETFRTPLTSPPGTIPGVEVGKSVYLGLAIDTEETYLALEASSCWSTYSENPDDPMRYDILQGGCPNPVDEKKGLQHLYTNFNSTTVEVSFRAFTWPKVVTLSQRMYIHCEVSICDWVLDQTCVEKSCPETPHGSNDKGGAKITKVITLGPIKVQPKITECAENNGGCSHYCTVDGGGRKVCQCPMYWELEKNGLKCKVDEVAKKEAELSITKRAVEQLGDSSSSTGYIWTAFTVGIIVAVIAVVGAYFKITKRKGKGRFDL